MNKLKRAIFVTIAAILFATSVGPAMALPAGGGAIGGGTGLYGPDLGGDARAIRKKRAILAVRKEGLALRTADGGKLTEKHRAYL